MKIAFVYDRINKYGGAERVLEALHEIWPDAPLYTAVYDKKNAPWADGFDVKPSFLTRIPFAKNHHELFPWATPIAFETLCLDEYDVVISVTSAEAKGIITKPNTLHICYCLTPTRYLWSGYEEYIKRPGLGIFGSLARYFLKRKISQYREDDKIFAQRPDVYLAISNTVKKRILTYYKRDVHSVIYPPAAPVIPKSQIVSPTIKKPFYLCVSRLVGYKRVDIVVDAFTELNIPLVVIGDGWERKSLMRKAGPNVTFISRRLTDRELAGYYDLSKAFVFSGIEDLGLVSLEAQSYGKPVITYKQSGMAETVLEGKTGILFDEQSKKSLISAVHLFEKRHFSKEACIKNAEKFGLARFRDTFYDCVHTLHTAHRARCT